MNKITILIEGYAKQGDNDAYLASPTTTLVETNDKTILVDPGANSKLLRDALNKHSIKESDIDFIFLSHYHPDHFLNLKLFPNLDVVDGTMIWSGDKEFEHGGKIAKGVEVIATPGHAPEQASLLVETDEGIVCIAQDVFWWEDGKQKSEAVEELMSLVDPFVSDATALETSRKLVLEKADWIIPGHGKKFRNPSK